MGSGIEPMSMVSQTVARPSLEEARGNDDVTRSVTRMNTTRARRIFYRSILSPLKVAHDSVSQILLVPTVFDADMV